MRSKRFTNLFTLFILFVLAATASCQKDAAVKDPDPTKTSLSADSALLAAPGNYLAASGTLKIKIQDSTYTFDAATDSIAFINVHSDDDNRYFGITAINKDHTMSFGISSSGFVHNDVENGVAGSQFLLSGDYKSRGLQYSLSRYSGQKDFGNISVAQYKQDSVLAKGTFFTFLARDNKANSPFYKVEGTFDLKVR